jgi:hypothetical protein
MSADQKRGVVLIALGLILVAIAYRLRVGSVSRTIAMGIAVSGLSAIAVVGL